MDFIREELINKIKSVRQTVFERLELLESKYTPEEWEKDGNKIKDEVFVDQYCLVYDAFRRYPIFELKCGVLIFSQYDDYLIKDHL